MIEADTKGCNGEVVHMCPRRESGIDGDVVEAKGSSGRIASKCTGRKRACVGYGGVIEQSTRELGCVIWVSEGTIQLQSTRVIECGLVIELIEAVVQGGVIEGIVAASGMKAGVVDKRAGRMGVSCSGAERCGNGRLIAD